MADPRKETQVKLRCRCGKKIRIPISFAGQKGKCPKCGYEMQVPEYEDLMRLKQRQGDGPDTRRVEAPEEPSLPDAVENPAFPSAEVPALDEEIPFDEDATLDGNLGGPARKGATTRRIECAPTEHVLPAVELDDLEDEDIPAIEDDDIESGDLARIEAEDTAGDALGHAGDLEDSGDLADAAGESHLALDLESDLDSGMVPEIGADEAPYAEETDEAQYLGDISYGALQDSFESIPAVGAGSPGAPATEDSSLDLEAELDEFASPPEVPAAAARRSPEPAPPPPPPPPPPKSEEELRAEKVGELLAAARAADRDGDPERAIAAYGEVLALDPGNARALYHRGRSRLATGDTDHGLVDLSEAIERGFPRRRARLCRLRAYRRLGRTKGLLEELDRAALELPWERERYRREKVRVLERAGDPGGLLEALDQLAEVSDLGASGWNRHGVLCDRLGDTARARESFARAIEIAPDRPAYRFNLANVDLREGRWTEAIRGYERVVELDPGDRQAWVNLGVCYRSLDPPQRRKAMACFRRAEGA